MIPGLSWVFRLLHYDKSEPPFQASTGAYMAADKGLTCTLLISVDVLKISELKISILTFLTYNARTITKY